MAADHESCGYSSQQAWCAFTHRLVVQLCRKWMDFIHWRLVDRCCVDARLALGQWKLVFWNPMYVASELKLACWPIYSVILDFTSNDAQQKKRLSVCDNGTLGPATILWCIAQLSVCHELFLQTLREDKESLCMNIYVCETVYRISIPSPSHIPAVFASCSLVFQSVFVYACKV